MRWCWVASYYVCDDAGEEETLLVLVRTLLITGQCVLVLLSPVSRTILGIVRRSSGRSKKTYHVEVVSCGDAL